jgi:hypothetical protein
MRFSFWATVAVICFSVTSSQAEDECLKHAWASFNKAEYQTAIRAADECIEQFSRRADRDEAILEARREPEPPIGAVGDADKQKIFGRGVLNDVGAAFFVKGRSAEALAKRTKQKEFGKLAKDAYASAAKLKYARVWDPQGWFWSPSEAAADRLSSLK